MPFSVAAKQTYLNGIIQGVQRRIIRAPNSLEYIGTTVIYSKNIIDFWFSNVYFCAKNIQLQVAKSSIPELLLNCITSAKLGMHGRCRRIRKYEMT